MTGLSITTSGQFGWHTFGQCKNVLYNICRVLDTQLRGTLDTCYAAIQSIVDLYALKLGTSLMIYVWL